MNRSQIRHALYRAKNGIFSQDKKHIYDLVEPLIPYNETWATFSKNWDIFYKDQQIKVVKPETDYDFIHTTCLEKSLHEKNNIPMHATDRQLNAIQIVELNMLDGKMNWENYNKNWGISIDYDLKRVNTRLFSTHVNDVTEDMIKKSAPSDGSAMSEIPSIPEIKMTEPQPMSDSEVAQFNKSLKNNKKK